MSETTEIYPGYLREGNHVLVGGSVYTISLFRDSKIPNMRTGLPDIAIEFAGEDWSLLVPRDCPVPVVTSTLLPIQLEAGRK